ncbi:MAG: cupin domain-containing protein [Candidatus Methylomirabilaceae bacterium]
MEWGEAATLKRFSPEKAQKIGLFRTDRSMTDLHCLLPGQSQRPHAHERSDKVYYVIEGTARFRIGREERQLSSGAAVLAPATIEHGVENAGSGPLVLLVVLAPPLPKDKGQ